MRARPEGLVGPGREVEAGVKGPGFTVDDEQRPALHPGVVRQLPHRL
jgi:hypothetical protein